MEAAYGLPEDFADLAEKINDVFDAAVRSLRAAGANPTGAEVNALRLRVRQQTLAAIPVVVRQHLRGELVASADANADLYSKWPGLKPRIR